MSNEQPAHEFTPPSVEEIGTLLPAYEILHFIAKGGMGAVYMARQKSLDREVAIKILPRHFGEDDAFRASFETEAKSMAKLNHPNLVGIYDFGQVDGMLYIIMELVKGKSLYHSAYGKAVDPTKAAEIVIGICQGLSDAHKQDILHRDIKPANILLTPEAAPKIGDFGLARPVDEDYSEASFGTPGYAAPEIIHDPRAVDASTDLYAVGAILYELLTGHLPDTVYSPVASEVNGDPRFDRIIRKAMHPTPALRYRKAQDMARDIQKILDQPAKQTPQLVTGNSPASSSGGRTLVTAASKATGATGGTLVTPQTVNTTRTTLKAPTQSANGDTSQDLTDFKPSKIPLIRNIIIIIALVAAIFIALEVKDTMAASHAKKQREQDRKKELYEKAQAAKKEKLRQERLKEFAEAQKNKPEPKPDLPPTPDPPKETAMESLARLRSNLFNGDRSELPLKTIRSGNRARFYVSTPMSWHAAQQFCERHGGHLPVIAQKAALQSFTRNLSDYIWLGAGTSGDRQWCWIDGTPWNLEIRNTSKPSYVSVDDTGVLRPQAGQTKLPFFIEWLMDGSQPATIENQLKRCAQSLDSGSPVYPAGTAIYSGRFYLYIAQEADWSQARQLARSAGATLAVTSDPEENIWITNYIANILTKDQHCWLGGVHPASQTWKWITGEPWQFATWEQGSPNDDTTQQLACAINANGKWEDFTTSTPLPALLIEWSTDNQGHEAIEISKKAPQPSDPVKPLRSKCITLLKNLDEQYEARHKSNVFGYSAELRSYQRRLPRSLKSAYAGIIHQLSKNIKNNRIGLLTDDSPDAGQPKSKKQKRESKKQKPITMPAELLNIYQDRLNRQNRIEKEHTGKIQTIQEKYRTSLTTLANQFKTKGLASQVKRVQSELDNTNTTPEKFAQYILGN